MNDLWSPSSWRTKNESTNQLPLYKDQNKLASVCSQLKNLPPLVHPKECDRLTELLASAIDNKSFVLWGGDCAEEFQDCNSESIETKFKVLLQMSLKKKDEGRKPVVRIGRMAGQYGKPRTTPTETLADGTVVQTYKGDMVNGIDICEREPDPNRMLEGYFRSATTLNYLRTLCNGGAASLHALRSWNLEQVLSPHLKKAYNKVVKNIVDGVDFVDVVAGSAYAPVRDSVELFVSHEALLLEYEEAMTRSPKPGLFYDLSAHLVWIGDRTRNVESGHVEFCSGIRNPVAIKIGPTSTPDGVIALVNKLNPQRIKGRLTLITRFGCSKVEAMLPPLIRAVQTTNIPVLWVCDPCHGNTVVSAASKIKTRNFNDILTELQLTMRVLAGEGAHLGGMHLELTGECVTECTGGAAELGEASLSRNFKSLCDPRLNYAQSLDLSFRVGGELKKSRMVQFE